MKSWREELAAMGYRFQFITLAGWHALNLSMFELASAYREDGMLGYSQMQQREFGQERAGYRATKHQAFVGTGYFDAVQTAITAGQTSDRGNGRQHRDRAVPRGGGSLQSRNVWSPKDHAAAIAEHFRAYNDEFGRITRRAALNFLAEDWHSGSKTPSRASSSTSRGSRAASRPSPSS